MVSLLLGPGPSMPFNEYYDSALEILPGGESGFAAAAGY
jgi:hypothetical protein